MVQQTDMLSIVMPAYNEEQCIYSNLLTTAEIVEDFYSNYEIILVNDGSTDHTFSEAMRAREENHRIKVLTYHKNRGKGGAIKEGIQKAQGAYIAFLDADLDLSPRHLERFMEQLICTEADIVIGSKLHKDSRLHYPFTRKILSYGYYLLLHLLFHLQLKDTQTGVKLFRAEIIKPIAFELKTTGYAFDIEILARACQKHAKILEMPVFVDYKRITEQSGSRIRLQDIYSMFIDTLKIFRDIRQDA